MDREAEFGRLYEAHRTAVHAYFVGRTADRWLAADLMQEVFMRVWQQLPELLGRSRDGQRAWIFTVARNLSIDAFRHERTRAGAEAALGDEPGPAPPSAATAVIAAERVAIVGEAIRRLPEQQRTTLAMAAAGCPWPAAPWPPPWPATTAQPPGKHDEPRRRPRGLGR